MNPLKAMARVPGRVSRHVARKVWAGTAGAGIGVPVSKVTMWLLTDSQFGGVEFPPEIRDQVTMLIEMAVTTAAAFVVGYVTPERES